MKRLKTSLALLVGGLCLVAQGPVDFSVSESAAEFNDSRDMKSSKAKSSIRQVRKKFADLDEAINDPKKLKNDAFYERRIDTIQKNIDKIPSRDPGWDTSKEKAYLSDLKKRWAKAKSAAVKEEMEGNEPDPVPLESWGGAPLMKAQRPTWCEGVELPDVSKGRGPRDYEGMATKLTDDGMVTAAVHACQAPDFKKRQQWSAVWRQAIANRTGADERLVNRFYKLWAKHGGRYGDDSLMVATCNQYTGVTAKNTGGSKSRGRRGRSRSGGSVGKRAGGSVGQRAGHPKDEDYKTAMAYALGCKGNPIMLSSGWINTNHLTWWMDGDREPPNELTRALFILDHIGLDLGGDSHTGRAEGDERILKNLGVYALVATDLARLDEAKFKKELQAMNLNEWGQVMATLTFTKAKHMGRIYQQAYKKMDRSIQELAFKVPQAGYKQWEAQYAANKAGMDLAREVEAKFRTNRKSDIRNCHEKAHAAYTKYVTGAAKSIKSDDDKMAIKKDAIANTLLRTSVVCAAFEGKHGIAASLYKEGLENSRQWRGPRFAAYWTMLEKFMEMREKDSSMPLTERDVGFWIQSPSKDMAYAGYEETFNKTAITMSQSGRVKKVQKKGDMVKLTFVTESWQETVWDCKETRKIDRIASDGRIIYRQKCKAKGKKTVKSTTKPFMVPKVLAAGIKKNSFVKANVEFKKGGSVGVPVAVYKSKKQKKLTGSLGASF